MATGRTRFNCINLDQVLWSSWTSPWSNWCSDVFPIRCGVRHGCVLLAWCVLVEYSFTAGGSRIKIADTHKWFRCIVPKQGPKCSTNNYVEHQTENAITRFFVSKHAWCEQTISVKRWLENFWAIVTLAETCFGGHRILPKTPQTWPGETKCWISRAVADHRGAEGIGIYCSTNSCISGMIRHGFISNKPS